MRTKLLLLANLLALVLTLACYVWVMQLALSIGEKVLEYLDAVMEIAQLS